MKEKCYPNLLIVGAAKSGTTSLHNYLLEHPEIAMSFPKEPKYLSYCTVDVKYSGPEDEYIKDGVIKSEPEYLDLFDSDQKFNGESSADSLYYYKSVIPFIKNTPLFDPSIVIVLRNPVERAYSAYTHLRRDNRETEDFDTALKLEKERIQKGYEFIWHYKDVGLYFEQVKAFIDNFSNCQVILFEDLKNNPQKVIDDICLSIGASQIELGQQKIFNKSGVPKKNLKTVIYRIIKTNKLLRKFVGAFMSKRFRTTLRERIRQEFLIKNLDKAPRLDITTKKELIEFYSNDIIKLQQLINRDLSHWLK
ncbi:sulfotransferase domain-containing protein [Aquimarina pacifica]|uniref:sulfotransferase domain-containing protein n=1 Tax=Aquimarina pacifica TaxID=1296415 RepID=UPI00046E874A|nr:sulfotransferase domain-containing protein [Aquimarina pacifica]